MKKKKITRGGTRTRNLRFRRPTPYPLGHTGFLFTLLKYTRKILDEPKLDILTTHISNTIGSHRRIVSYKFGDFNMLVRFEVDCVIKEQLNSTQLKLNNQRLHPVTIIIQSMI